MTSISHRLARATLALGLAATVLAGPAEARRGGSFGSRGSRTYSAPRSTGLTPGYGSGVSRSMTARPATTAAPSYAPRDYAPQRRGGFGGFGGGLLTGVLAGGLIGGLLGHHGGGGWGAGGGGGGGLLAILIQIAILGGLAWLVLRLFRGNRQAAPSPGFGAQQAYAAAPPPPPADTGTDIGLSAADQQAFERLLGELQDAFGREDYGRLRAIATPEIMSYLAEELSDNATHGRRNEVTGTRLLDAEVSEAWQEDDADYATVALRYQGVDVMRDRTTGAVLSGDPDRPTVTTELWTFVRPAGSDAWKVSAIQEA